MHYCTRPEERTAFAERIGHARCSIGSLSSRCSAGGSPLDLSAVFDSAPTGAHLYVSGPRGFMDAVLGTARGKGWPENRLHYEFFSAVAVRKAADKSFRVRIASTGATVEVAAGCTVVQAPATNGVEVLASCEQGVCGTCLTRIFDDKPEHRDSYLTPDERAANDQFLPCCSRSESSLLVLDL